MRRIFLIFSILLLISRFPILGFNSNHRVDFSAVEGEKWENINKIEIKPIILNLLQDIKYEKLDIKNKTIQYIFSDNETWVVDKYDKNNLYKTTLIERAPCIFINNKLIFPNIDAFSTNNKFVGLVYMDPKNNLLTSGSSLSIDIYDYKNNEYKILLTIDTNIYKILRLLNVINEYIYVAGWVNENIHGVPEYSYIKLYKYNLLKKEVEIFDSYDYGIVSNGVDEVEGFFPVYDISHDQRYVYIPARGDREYIRNKLFNREKMKMSGGLYVFDWWQNKLYKLFEGNVVAVTNNTEDGYVYIKTMKYENNHHIYEYFRFKNPEEMLEKIDY